MHPEKTRINTETFIFWISIFVFKSKSSNGYRSLLDLHGRSQSPALVGTDNKRTPSQMSEARSEVGGISSLRFGYDV